MSDEHGAQAAQAARPQAPRNGYQGRPENQRNPRAPNTWRGPPRQQTDRPRPPSVRDAPSVLPRATKRHDASSVKLTESSPADSSLFASGMSVRETVPRQVFTPSAPAAIEISRQSYAELITDDNSLSKIMLPEYLDYYATAMLWLRITTLKQKNSQPITPIEDQLLTLTQTTPFVLPEPILLQVRQLGNTVSKTGQHLFPSFPPLPTFAIQGNGGYFGLLQEPGVGVNNNIHNLYEELPCLGVLAEAVQASLSNNPPGPYVSHVTYRGQQPNANLLGFRPLGTRRAEPKNLAFDCNITDANFPSYPAQTSFNYEFLVQISNVLANTKTFKNTEVVFSTLSEVGSTSQLVISRPTSQVGMSCLRGEQTATSLSNDPISTFGSAVFFDSQLMKEPAPNDMHNSWCLFNPHGDIVIPVPWINNRNIRRTLPIQYNQRVFESISQQASAFRLNIIRNLVLSKR